MAGRVSVIIPTYNGEPFLADAVNSVWDQTVSAHELVVVDDCSRDGTVSLARDLARRSPVPMRVVALDRNSGGPARPINVGLRLVEADYVAVLDQDDIFLTNRLATHAAALDAEPAAIIAFGYCSAPDHPGVPLQPVSLRSRLEAIGGRNHASQSRLLLPGEAVAKSLVTEGNYIYGFPGFTMRREVRELKVDESYRIAGDLDLLLRMSSRGAFALVPAPCYVRREHANNLTRMTMRTDLEVLRAWERSLRRGGVADEPEVRASARGRFELIAYRAREAGKLADSLRVLRRMIRIWGWDRWTLAMTLKAIPAWLLGRLISRTHGLIPAVTVH